MRKKYFAFLMAAVISAVVLTACGGTGTEQNAAQGGTGQESGASGSSQSGTGQETGAAGSPQSGTSQETGGNGDSQGSTAVTEDQARSTALTHAGVTEEEITGIRVKKDHEDGRQVYDVEFYVGNKEYDYEIDASTGEILSADFEIEDDFNKDNATNLNPAVSQEEASAAALAKVPGAEAKDLRIKLEEDDGKLIYVGDIYYSGTEYEFEIDASTGDFLKWSEERD